MLVLSSQFKIARVAQQVNLKDSVKLIPSLQNNIEHKPYTKGKLPKKNDGQDEIAKEQTLFVYVTNIF